jgi:hypothetical protein
MYQNGQRKGMKQPLIDLEASRQGYCGCSSRLQDPALLLLRNQRPSTPARSPTRIGAPRFPVRKQWAKGSSDRKKQSTDSEIRHWDETTK